MAIWQSLQISESISLQEFMDYASRCVDFSDQDSQLELAPQLTMLGNNREFLTEFMSHYVQDNLNSLAVEGTISQAVVMASNPRFYLRMAFWLPEADITTGERQLYAYDQAHDHNFDFLSLAYCGSGYKTDLYEYDYAATAGYIGEKVGLRPLGRHHHQTGDVLFYRCNRDIHFQRPPDTPSITLNVISLVNQHGLKDQYFFRIPDVDSTEGTIYRHAEGNIEGRRTLLQIARHFRGPRLIRILADFALSYACQRTRMHALEALSEADQETYKEICEQLRDDPSPLVRYHLASVERV